MRGIIFLKVVFSFLKLNLKSFIESLLKKPGILSIVFHRILATWSNSYFKPFEDH